MFPALILLAVLGIVALPLWLHERRYRRRHPDEAAADVPVADAAGCADDSCALHNHCPSRQLLTAACTAEAAYFDDEELDAYAGRAADDYSEVETEQFREVLLTLRPTEVLPWHHSLRRRGVQLPAALHDELLLLAADA